MNIVFLINEYSLHNHLLEKLISERPKDSISIVKISMVLKGKSKIDSASRIFPKLSRRFLLNKIVEFVLIFIITHIPKIYHRGAIFRRLSWIARKHNSNFHKTDNVMSDNSLEFIKMNKPDIIFSLCHQILKKELIDIPKYGVINIHPGVLPDTKGIQPYFWNLISPQKTPSGVTFHYINDETIDTGAIIARSLFTPWKGISVQLNYFLTIQCACNIISKIVAGVQNGELEALVQDRSKGNYYTWPETKDIDRLYEQNYRIISLKDLYKILTGRFDDFKAEKTVIYFKNISHLE